MPLLGSCRSIFDLLAKDTLIIFDECKNIDDVVRGVYEEHTERVRELQSGGEAFSFSQNQLLAPEILFEKFKNYRCLALQNFASSTAFFRPLKMLNLHSTPAP